MCVGNSGPLSQLRVRDLISADRNRLKRVRAIEQETSLTTLEAAQSPNLRLGSLRSNATGVSDLRI